MKSTLKSIALAASLAFAVPIPAMAQDAAVDDPEAAELEAAMAMLGSMFTVEPLTEDQTVRLPLAEQIVAKMIPEGSMAEMMGGMFDEMLGPIMQMAGPPSGSIVADQIGVLPTELELDDAQSAELAQMFDLAWEERNRRQMALFPEMLSGMMAAMEPAMRTAMSELYAINFSEAQLTEIDAFFATETGTAFARKSFTMASDPRIMAASMEAFPAMMGMLGDLEQKMLEVSSDLPPIRSFDELSADEKARIAELTGFSSEEIEANLAELETIETQP